MERREKEGDPNRVEGTEEEERTKEADKCPQKRLARKGDDLFAHKSINLS